jgi:hypothetical protein
MTSPHLELDRLQKFPSVSSVVSSTEINTHMEIPHMRELLYASMWSPLMGDNLSVSPNLPGFDALFATGAPSIVRLKPGRPLQVDVTIPRHLPPVPIV